MIFLSIFSWFVSWLNNVIFRILGRAGRFLWEGFNPRSLTGLHEGVTERRSQKNPWQEYNYLQQSNTAEYNNLLETLHSLKVLLYLHLCHFAVLFHICVNELKSLWCFTCRRKEQETQAYWPRPVPLWRVWTNRPISSRSTLCFCKSNISSAVLPNRRCVLSVSQTSGYFRWALRVNIEAFVSDSAFDFWRVAALLIWAIHWLMICRPSVCHRRSTSPM